MFAGILYVRGCIHFPFAFFCPFWIRDCCSSCFYTSEQESRQADSLECVVNKKIPATLGGSFLLPSENYDLVVLDIFYHVSIGWADMRNPRQMINVEIQYV